MGYSSRMKISRTLWTPEAERDYAPIPNSHVHGVTYFGPKKQLEQLRLLKSTSEPYMPTPRCIKTIKH